MADAQEANETQADTLDEVIAPAEDTASEQTTDKPAKKKRSFFAKLLRFILMIVLLVAVAAAILAATGRLQPLWETLQEQMLKVQERAPTLHPTPHKATITPATTEATATDDQRSEAGDTSHEMPAPQTDAASSQAASDATAPTTPASATIEPATIEPATINRLPSTPLSPEKVEQLLTTMQQLQQELARMAQSQRLLMQGLKAQQRMNLQVRLRWITDPNSRLAQIALTWEEISLLPGLSDAERQQAVQMHALARSAAERLRLWRQALRKWAETLTTPEQQNVLPQPEHPWLAWLVNQFQLRRAPTVSVARQQALRAQLLQAEQQLAQEQWPEAGAWQQLQAELLLQIKAMEASADKAAIDTGLPVNFHAIQADLAKLRQTARAWAAKHGGAS